MSAFGRSRQLVDLRADVTFLADLPTSSASTFITTQNLTDLINAGIAELFNIIVDVTAEDTYLKTATITTDGVTYAYPLPSDFYRLKRVEYSASTGDILPMHRFTIEERGFLLSSAPGWDGEPFRYNVTGKTTIGIGNGSVIELLPLPAANKVVTIAYIFCPTRLIADGDSLDGFAGFEDYAILFAAWRCAVKAENFELAGTLGGERERVKANVIAMMNKRDADNPPKTRIVRTNNAMRRFGRWF